MKDNSRNATIGEIFLMLAIVAALLVLAWFMEAGNTIAAVLWGGIGLIATIGAYFVSRKQNRQDN
ncbi:MAG: hypothetical protein AAF351_14125 [Pseudomonadota bacterium]